MCAPNWVRTTIKTGVAEEVLGCGVSWIMYNKHGIASCF